MRVLGLMVLFALTGCQSPPPLDTTQAQCQAPSVDNTNPAWSHCANELQMVRAKLADRWGSINEPLAYGALARRSLQALFHAGLV